MVSVALYILDSGEKQMLEDRAICDEYAGKNGYEIKKVFSEPLIQGMDNYGKRLDFLTFIGELQELGVEHVIVPSPKHLKGFDVAAYEAFFASTGAEMLFIEERKTKNGAAINDYGRKAAQRVTKEKEKKRSSEKPSDKPKVRKVSAPNIDWHPMENKKIEPADYIDWDDFSTVEHSEYVSSELLIDQKTKMKLVDMPPGTGKTAVAVAAIGRMQARLKRKMNVVITSTTKVIDQLGWHNTIASWNNAHPDNTITPILITTIDLFKNATKHRQTYNKILKAFQKDNEFPYDNAILVLDEVHKYKAPTGIRAKQLQKLRMVKRIGLSGTPITNDIVNDQMSYLIMADFYDNKSDFVRSSKIDQFIGQYGKYNVYMAEGHRINRVMWPYYDTVIDQMSKVLYRPDINMKDLGIPEARRHIIQLPNDEQLDADMRSLVYAKEKRMFDSYKDFEMEVIRRLHSDETRLNKLMSVIKRDDVNQPLIFYTNTIVKDFIIEAFEKEGIHDYQVISGGNKNKEDIDKKRNAPILIQYTSGSEGIEFKMSNTTLFYQNQFSYAVLDQAKGRNARRGMKHEVNHHFIIADNAFDQAIYNVVMEREVVAHETLVDIEERKPEISVEEMSQLLERVMEERYGSKA